MGNKPIVHAPIATGSTEPRDIRDRFGDLVNLKDFGAVGDGLTDDSSAWAAWQTALKNGGMAYAPKGDYLLNDKIIHIPNGKISNNTNIFEYEDDGDIWNDSFNSIYVDGENGNDTNSGMTELNPVKTITRAIQISEILNGKSYIYIEAGTYTENITISDNNIEFLLNGAITLAGFVHCGISHVVFKEKSSNSSSLTISYNDTDGSIPVHVSNSDVLFECVVSVNITDTANTALNTGCFLSERHSLLKFTKNLTITVASNVALNELFYCINSSSIDIGNNSVNLVNNSNNLSRIFVTFVSSDIQLHNTTFYCTSNVIDLFCRAGYKGILRIQSVVFSGNLSCSVFAQIYENSFADVATCSGTINVKWLGFFATGGSYVLLRGNNLQISASSGTYAVFDAQRFGQIMLESGTMKITGSATDTAFVANGGIICIESAVSFSGSSVTAKRYVSSRGSLIMVSGQGANRIPGTTAGSVDNGGQYY